MGIHKRLLFSLIGVAAGIVILFAVSVYRIALDAGNAHAADMLRGITGQRAIAMGRDPSSHPLLLSTSPSDAHEGLISSLLGARGEIIAGPDIKTMFPGRVLPFELSSPHAREGRVTGVHPMLWASAPVPGSAYTLVSIYRGEPGVSSVFARAATELLVTTCVVLLLAIAGAALLSRRIRENLDEQRAHRAYHTERDQLTGLANRGSLHQRLSGLLHDTAAPCAPLALLILDLDRFREINDTLGHDIGDEVLKQVAVHLRQALPQAEITARVSGDEFALLLRGADLHAALAVAQQVQVALTPVVNIRDIEINMQASVGIALFPQHGHDADVLLRCAEVAMYNAKRQGLSHVIYSQDCDPFNMRRLMLMSDLRRAIHDRQLVLYYQPKVDLRTHRTMGVEALLRWRHPVHGFIPPEDFIPLAEQSDLIRQITYWVIDEALLQCRAWRQTGIVLDVAVNLSARNLHDPGLPAKVAGLLAKWSVPASQLTLEITENAIMLDPERALKILERLHSMGVRLSIDDFGTGYSSLVYLKRLPVTQIKIDRSFVIDMISDENDAIIVRSTIDLGHNLGCHVVAEGVETLEILERLKALGCDFAQGYYLSRPVPAEELTAWLSQSAWEIQPRAQPVLRSTRR